jgi:hypothetical protein
MYDFNQAELLELATSLGVTSMREKKVIYTPTPECQGSVY